MSPKSWVKSVDGGINKKKRGHRSEGKLTESSPSPQSAPLVSETSSGLPSKICTRLTLTLCACGAALGFCFMVAGGVEKHHYGNIKVLMYIGIVMFLVSVTLLVILYSSFGIFSIHPAVANVPEVPQCTCPVDSFEIIPTKHLMYSGSLNSNPPQFIIPHCCHVQESRMPNPKPKLPHNEDTIGGKDAVPQCAVKNCVCLLKNMCDDDIKAKEPQKGILQTPVMFDHSINICSSQYYGNPCLTTTHVLCGRHGIKPCIHYPHSSHDVVPAKVLYNANLERPLRNLKPNGYKGRSTRTSEKEEVSIL